MDTNAIILALAGLVVFGLIYRSVSSKPEKTVANAPEPSPYDQEALESLTKNQLIEVANSLGVEVRASWTKSKIIQVIIIAVNDQNSTN